MSRPAALFASALLLASSARAAIYERAISADDEEGLYSLQQAGEISDGTLETLLELMREGVDLNSASREELYDLPGLTYSDVDRVLEYRKAKGRIQDPAELVGSGALTAEQLLQVAPFIRLDAGGGTAPVAGRLRSLTAFTASDNVPPPTLLGARLKGPADLTAGLLLETTRRSPAPVHYDPLLDTLVTPGMQYQAWLPRAFLQWNSSHRRLLVGTFTVGFGERLVLDNTRRFTPHGIYLSDDFRRPPDLSRTCRLSSPNPLTGDCADGAPNLYVTPDFLVRDAFRGLAASLEDVSLGGEASLSAYGFLSFQSRSLYQYELYDRRDCSDPRNDSDPACKAPTVYVDSPTNPGSTKVVFSTLPALYDELAGGGHLEVKPDYHSRVGITGYAAAPFFKATPMSLDFQEYSRTPWGGSYGVLGVDGQYSLQDLNFYIEAARSFDHATGGGFGVVQRSTWSPRKHELELSLRFYDDKFANPNGRPVSGPDEYDGQRARDEAGARLRWHYRPNRDWTVKARADFWVLPYTIDTIGPAGTANLYGQVRGDFEGWAAFQPSLWVDVRNRNLASSEHGKCSSGTIVYTEGQPFTCSGDTYKVVGRVELRPWGPKHLLLAQGYFSWTDDVRYKDRFRNDVMVFAEGRTTLFDVLHLRLKTRWLFQDISDNTYLEQSWWTFLEAQVYAARGTQVGVRYDVLVWLDQRTTTLTRVPNPEHRFLLDLRWMF